MAFHLGCLRTLDQTGILPWVNVMSTVSGGAVIGAMYVTHRGKFSEFETWVRLVLEKGFVRPALKTAFTTTAGPKAVASFTRLIGWRFISLAPMIADAGMNRFRPEWRRRQAYQAKSLPLRTASRTTILQETFDRELFRGKKLGDLASVRPRLITISAELRTRTAFYFSPGNTGSYRFGRIEADNISLAEAVVASAAYPLLLPALDKSFTFITNNGLVRDERVTLTDGGVYDNLGLAPLWPDRDSKISIGVEPVDTIIACRAGYGRRMEEPSLFFGSRMNAVFSCTSARAENQSTNRLFDLKQAGRLRSVCLPYLDQNDANLRFAPPDLVTRNEVADYPTNFSAMPKEWIDRLSRRGEQLTLAVLKEHIPELLALPPLAASSLEQQEGPL